jgi:hypothetical protein
VKGATLLFKSELQANGFIDLLDPIPEWREPPGTLNEEGEPFRSHPRLAPDALVDYMCGYSGENTKCHLIPKALVPWFVGLLQQALANLKALDISRYDDLSKIETPWYIEEFDKCVTSIANKARCEDFDFLAITVRG